MESKKELTDIKTPYVLAHFSDTEKYEKLVQFKATLFRNDLFYHSDSPRNEDPYFNQSHNCLRRVMQITFTGGFFALFMGPFFLIYSKKNASDMGISNNDVLILGGLLTGVGMLLCIACCLFNWSSKFRSDLLGCIDRPIFLPANFNKAELNHLLTSSGISELKTLSTTKDLKKAYTVIDAAIKATNTSQQFEIRKKTLLSLQTTGLFAEGQKLVLEYLIPSEEALNKPIDKPPQQDANIDIEANYNYVSFN